MNTRKFAVKAVWLNTVDMIVLPFIILVIFPHDRHTRTWIFFGFFVYVWAWVVELISRMLCAHLSIMGHQKMWVLYQLLFVYIVLMICYCLRLIYYSNKNLSTHVEQKTINVYLLVLFKLIDEINFKKQNLY